MGLEPRFSHSYSGMFYKGYGLPCLVISLCCSTLEHSTAKNKRQNKGRGENTLFLFYLPPLYLFSHISMTAVFQIQHRATLGSNDTRCRQAPNHFFSLFSTAQILILMFPESRTSPGHMKGKSLGMSYNSS